MPQIIIPILIATALSVAASLLLRPKTESTRNRGGAQNEATRGATIPYVIGRRRVGSIVGWVGGRSSSDRIFYEQAMHLLCVGPAWALHGIWESGKQILTKTITRDNTPSGSTISTPLGSFEIYWGEVDQPVNTWLGNENRVTVTSRWPFVCYLVWNKKELGTAAQWPVIEYEIETRIEDVVLTDSNPWFERTLSDLTGSAFNVKDVTPNTIDIPGKHTTNWNGGTWLTLIGNPAAGDYLVDTASYDLLTDRTTMVFLETLTGITANTGSVQRYFDHGDDGVGAAHAIYQMLFAAWPYGLSLDTEEWDLASLESLGVLLETERVPVNILAEEGKSVELVIGEIMQDLGVMISLDPTTGKQLFRAVRQPVSSPVVTEDMILPPLPEIDVPLDERPTNRIIFEFNDRLNNFRNMTIDIDDDATVIETGQRKETSIDINVATDLATANIIAERRSQEVLAGLTRHKLKLNREARLMQPGLTYSVAGIDTVLRVLEVRVDPLTSKVEVVAVEDFYGTPASTYITLPGNPADGLDSTAEPDLDVDFLEVPPSLAGGVAKLWVARIRAGTHIVEAKIHVATTPSSSPEPASYTEIGSEATIFAGGTLVASFGVDGPYLIEDGPIIDEFTPNSDMSNVLNLTGSETLWRSGLQIAAITEGSQTEFFFLRNVLALGGGQYQLKGLLRSRLGEGRIHHSNNSRVFIFNSSTAIKWDNLAIASGKFLWVKTQPIDSNDNEVPLEDITPETRYLWGKGKIGMRTSFHMPSITRVDMTVEKRLKYRSDDVQIDFVWAYKVAAAGTGAGGYGAGTGQAHSSPAGTWWKLVDYWNGSSWVNIPSFTSTNAFRWLSVPIATVKTANGGVVPSKIRVTARHIIGSAHPIVSSQELELE